MKFLRVFVSPWLLRGPENRRQGLLLASVLVLVSADLAFAQADLAGSWRPLARNEDGSGMVGDAAGLPITQSSRFGTPFEARQGGPETMYPEYIAKIGS